jgi:hypothetical protein
MRFTILQWRLNQYATDLRNEGGLLWETLEKLLANEPKSVAINQ